MVTVRATRRGQPSVANPVTRPILQATPPLRIRTSPSPRVGSCSTPHEHDIRGLQARGENRNHRTRAFPRRSDPHNGRIQVIESKFHTTKPRARPRCVSTLPRHPALQRGRRAATACRIAARGGTCILRVARRGSRRRAPPSSAAGRAPSPTSHATVARTNALSRSADAADALVEVLAGPRKTKASSRKPARCSSRRQAQLTREPAPHDHSTSIRSVIAFVRRSRLAAPSATDKSSVLAAAALDAHALVRRFRTAIRKFSRPLAPASSASFPSPKIEPGDSLTAARLG